mmetsp:Transcript_24842/g.60238  ORF Transcript_24842/g.60238 Transcript_24842/m.60238 type:complete len:213 (-) Transcript_24842:2-640(-)
MTTTCSQRQQSKQQAYPRRTRLRFWKAARARTRLQRLARCFVRWGCIRFPRLSSMGGTRCLARQDPTSLLLSLETSRGRGMCRGARYLQRHSVYRSMCLMRESLWRRMPSDEARIGDHCMPSEEARRGDHCCAQGEERVFLFAAAARTLSSLRDSSERGRRAMAIDCCDGSDRKPEEMGRSGPDVSMHGAAKASASGGGGVGLVCSMEVNTK